MIEGVEIFGIDSLIRPGSELNRRSLPKYGCKIFYGDVRSRSDLDQLPSVDWVIDAAANPSVSAGVDGSVSSRQLVEHNLLGTINVGRNILVAGIMRNSVHEGWDTQGRKAGSLH